MICRLHTIAVYLKETHKWNYTIGLLKKFLLLVCSFLIILPLCGTNGLSSPSLKSAQIFTASNNDFSQIPSNPPDSSAEKAFTEEAQNRLNNLQEANAVMIKTDKNLFQQGFDPNEKYFPEEAQRFQNQNDINNPYQNEENELRGNRNAFGK